MGEVGTKLNSNMKQNKTKTSRLWRSDWYHSGGGWKSGEPWLWRVHCSSVYGETNVCCERESTSLARLCNITKWGSVTHVIQSLSPTVQFRKQPLALDFQRPRLTQESPMQPDEATAMCHLCLLFPSQGDTSESSAPRVLRREVQAIRKCSKIKRDKAGQGASSSSNTTETFTRLILRFAHTRGSRKGRRGFLGVSSTFPHRWALLLHFPMLVMFIKHHFYKELKLF